MVYARDVEANYGKVGTPSEIALFTRTFSLSAFTTFQMLGNAACNYYGLIKEEFSLFWLEENTGNITNLSEQEQGTKVLSYLDLYA